MIESDKKPFAEIMLGLADNFGASLSAEGLQMRFDTMADLSIQDIKNAAMYLIKHRVKNFPPMPTIREFYHAIEKLSGKTAPENQAEIEANKIISHLNLYGSTIAPSLDDPISTDLMTRRWPYKQWASTIVESELKWWVREFKQLYIAVSENNSAKLIEADNEVKKIIHEAFGK